MQTSHNKKRPLLLPRALPASVLHRRRRRYSLAACLLSSVILFSGCAKDPPSSTSSITVSGHQLHVLISFNDTINPAYSYFFLLNYDQSQGSVGNKNGAGPIPVISPYNGPGGLTLGNGIAAGSTGGTSPGFTDYVQFGGGSVGATYKLFHVNPSDPTGSTVIDEGAPYHSTNPSGSIGNSKVLQFDLDLSQIVSASSGGALSATDTVTQAQAITYLQVNIIATNIVNRDPNSSLVKEVYSLGNTQNLGGQGSFLNLNVLDAGPIANPIAEPTGDVFTTDNSMGDPSLDIVSYNISVSNSGSNSTSSSVSGTKH